MYLQFALSIGKNKREILGFIASYKYISNYKNSFIDNSKDKQKFHWVKLIMDLLTRILIF